MKRYSTHTLRRFLRERSRSIVTVFTTSRKTLRPGLPRAPCSECGTIVVTKCSLSHSVLERSMASPERSAFAALAATVPDEPDTLELRSMLLTARGDLVADAGGFVVTDTPRLVAAVWGHPDPRAIRSVVSALRGEEAAVLCRREFLDHVRGALPGA